VEALRGVDLDLVRGECLAVVGESGAGKTTLARSLLGLIRPAGGEVRFAGRDLADMSRDELLAFRTKAQIVFQDPFGSLNPRLRAGSMLEEVLKVHEQGSPPESRLAQVEELLETVGLHPGLVHRFPHELSGGQRQRLAIARALSVGPELLILDEPVSALDLSIQAQILNLLRDLQAQLRLTMLLVAHDLSVVRQVADRVVVMYQGAVVEVAPVADLFEDPKHPYTRGLLAAAGGNETTEDEDGWALLPEDPPSPMTPPEGCPFHPRCRHPARDRECVSMAPSLEGPRPARQVACWKEISGLTRA
jgi:oligopeptide/dipeptide ABC transporter ATP-binding protein